MALLKLQASEDTAMTDDRMALPALLEKNGDGGLVRDALVFMLEPDIHLEAEVR